MPRKTSSTRKAPTARRGATDAAARGDARPSPAPPEFSGDDGLTVVDAERSVGSSPPINSASQKGHKNTQRERLLRGMTEVAVRDGYAAASISEVIAHAGVSRPTFYDYFDDRNDCFLAAAGEAQRLLLAHAGKAVADEAPERASHAVASALISFASEQPTMARLLMSETMAGGPRAQDLRDQGIAQLERLIEGAYRQLGADARIPDLSGRMLCGGIYRLLASRLRRGESRHFAPRAELARWIESYDQPAGEHRWRALAPAPPAAPSPYIPSAPLRAPDPLPPGRSRLSKEQIAENHRQRIIFATGEAATQKGYSATKLTDITRLARLDSRAFYAQFANKQAAFMAMHELGFQQTMAVTAGAFFAGRSWPERIWEGGRASTQFLQKNPTIAYVGFVDSYAVGAGAVQRVEDALTAFTIFLQEGYQYQSQSQDEPRRQAPSPLALDAIAATNFEIAYYEARKRPDPQMAGLLPHITHLSLTPFTGAAQANELIDAMMRETTL